MSEDEGLADDTKTDERLIERRQFDGLAELSCTRCPGHEAFKENRSHSPIANTGVFELLPVLVGLPYPIYLLQLLLMPHPVVPRHAI